jgi:NTE family protein
MALRWNEWRSRLIRRRDPVAFVFSGGGALGALQVGLLRALMEQGIRPDLVVGTSVGALNAVFIAHDPTNDGVDKLRGIWVRMRRDDLFPGGRVSSAWKALRRGSHLYSNSGLRRLLETHIPSETFEELAVPAHVVATKIDTGEEAWFSSGRFVEPVLASAALPGALPPVTIDGVTYVDGGVANNVPVSRAVELGARSIYVLNVNTAHQHRGLHRPHDFMMHGMVLARAQRYRHDLERYRHEARIVELPAVAVGHVHLTDLRQTERLIDSAYESARAFLERLGGTAGPDGPVRAVGERGSKSGGNEPPAAREGAWVTEQDRG